MLVGNYGTMSGTDVGRYVLQFLIIKAHSVLSSSSSNVSDGIRAARLFDSSRSKCLNCIMMEVDPQKSTSPEKYVSPTAIVFVLQCENDLASFILNGARMELRQGDHLTIPTGSVFQFINSSLNATLKLRFIQKLPGRIFGVAHESAAVPNKDSENNAPDLTEDEGVAEN
jgi:glyoxylate utilization-related uncharacterized protein